MYQTTRTPKGTFSKSIREMVSGFKECLPPKMKRFIVKRPPKLTPDQTMHLHFYMPTRGLEAVRMVDALDRVDHTDALVVQILGDRAKLKQRSNRAHTHTSHFVQKQSSESGVTEQVEPIHNPDHATVSDSESDLDWDPECVDDDGYPLVDENGSTLVLVPRTGPLDEAEASSLSAWAQGYREARKNLRDSVAGRGYYKPESSRFDRKVRKALFAKRQPRRDRNVRAPFRERTREHGTEHVTGAELRKRTHCYRCPQIEHSENVRIMHRRITLRHHRKVFSCQVAHLHTCIPCLPTWRLRLCRKRWTGYPDKLEKVADWDTSNDEPEPHKMPIANRNFANFGCDLGASPWFDGHWCAAACGGRLSCSMVVCTTS